jgi:GNAT superfamily N-acetyltransferase
MLANTACSRPAQLRKLSISFDGCRSRWWRAADAEIVRQPDGESVVAELAKVEVMPDDQFIILHPDDRPDYRELIFPVSEAVFPEFMFHDRIANDHWDGLYERFPSYQFALLDPSTNAIAGISNSVPLAWASDPRGLPEEGWDWALLQSAEDYEKQAPPRSLCGIQISVAPAYQGKGISRRMIEVMRDLALSKRLESLVVPVRPNLKSSYPLATIDRYVEWKGEGGLPFDPWLRVHARAGGQIVKVCHRAMAITGTVSEWESWTGMRFPDSGQYVVPGALVPVEVDLAQDQGNYVEPNVWIHYQLASLAA